MLSGCAVMISALKRRGRCKQNPPFFSQCHPFPLLPSTSGRRAEVEGALLGDPLARCLLGCQMSREVFLWLRWGKEFGEPSLSAFFVVDGVGIAAGSLPRVGLRISLWVRQTSWPWFATTRKVRDGASGLGSHEGNVPPRCIAPDDSSLFPLQHMKYF